MNIEKHCGRIVKDTRGYQKPIILTEKMGFYFACIRRWKAVNRLKLMKEPHHIAFLTCKLFPLLCVIATKLHSYFTTMTTTDDNRNHVDF